MNEITSAEPVQSSNEKRASAALFGGKPNRSGAKKGLRRPTKLLADMRWIYENEKVENEQLTPGRKQCRDLQEKDSTEFLKMLRDLEKAHAISARRASTGEKPAKPTSGKGEPMADPRQESVQNLIAELMEQMRAG